MSDSLVVSIGQQAALMVLLLGGPVIGAALLVGLLVSVFQAATQINEMALTVVPKMIAIAVALAIFGPWMLSTMLSYTVSLFEAMPAMVR